jgi:hypothetical protein
MELHAGARMTLGSSVRKGLMSIELVQGDIVDQDTEAIVSLGEIGQARHVRGATR